MREHASGEMKKQREKRGKRSEKLKERRRENGHLACVELGRARD